MPQSFRIAFVLSAFLAPAAQGAVLRHAIMETDTSVSMQTGRACFGLWGGPGELVCAPRAYLVEPSGALGMDLRLKANDRAFTIVSRVLDKDVDPAFLETLFREDSFQSVSGAASVEARFRGTSFAYTPLHAVGAMTIDNPSLPEIHVAGARQSVLRLAHNFVFGDLGGAYAVVSPSVFRYERDFAYLDGDLLTSSGRALDKLVQRESERSVDADTAVVLAAGRPWVPVATLRIENLAQEDACPGCEERPIEIEPLFGRRSSLSLVWPVVHPIGASIMGAQLPFVGAFRSYDRLDGTVAYAYRIGSLGCFASFAPTITSFGFLFDADFYRMGIRYTDEKQDASLRIKRLKQVYVFAGFSY